MAVNLKARIAALRSTVAGGASGQATLARANAWRAWAESQKKDIITFCEYALGALTDANDPQHSGHTCRDLIIRGGNGANSYLDQVEAAAENEAKINDVYGLLFSRMAMTSLEVPAARPQPKETDQSQAMGAAAGASSGQSGTCVLPATYPMAHTMSACYAEVVTGLKPLSRGQV